VNLKNGLLNFTSVLHVAFILESPRDYLHDAKQLKAQDLSKRMTDCGNITTLRQHCIDKQKLTDLITQASKAFLFLRKKEPRTG